MKLLTFTSLYPNAIRPSHGVFVENRLIHLVRNGRITSRVLAPVPWFPSRHRRFGRYSEFARVPDREERHGIEVRHPRYLTIPGIGIYGAPLTMALAARRTIAKLIREGERFDAIDAHYFFPDGVAAILLGRWFDLPVVITARGSDITWFPTQALPRRMILWAARHAAGIVTVCRALKDELVRLGADGEKIVVLRNGVDAKRFAPIAMRLARERLQLPAEGKIIASVGALIPRKRHELVIDALALLPGVRLIIAGSGPLRSFLESHAARAGVADRISFLGQMAHDDLPAVYSAADASVLASENEGWANVLLESMACGTPVVATDAGGSSEVVAAPEAGLIVRERSGAAIAAALRNLLAASPDRAMTRGYAERFSWDETTRGQEQVFLGLAVSTKELQPSGTKQMNTLSDGDLRKASHSRPVDH